MTGKMVEIKMQKQEKDPHETEQHFDLVELYEKDEKEKTRIIFKEQEALIDGLQVNIQRENYIICYYEYENKKMETKQELMEVQLIKDKREAKKFKVQLEEAYDDYDEPMEENMLKSRPKIRGLKRALKLEREREAQLSNQLTLNEKFGIMKNENREYWIKRANNHLEDLLAKSKRNIEFQ